MILLKDIAQRSQGILCFVALVFVITFFSTVGNALEYSFARFPMSLLNLTAFPGLCLGMIAYGSFLAALSTVSQGNINFTDESWKQYVDHQRRRNGFGQRTMIEESRPKTDDFEFHIIAFSSDGYFSQLHHESFFSISIFFDVDFCFRCGFCS